MGASDEIAILRIELDDTDPPVWRRVAVHAGSTLATLHRVVQAAMGWHDSHLWEFQIGEKTYGMPLPVKMDIGRRLHRADRTKLATVLDTGLDGFAYVYDMGDYWFHRISVERIELAEPEGRYPRLLDGARRCPPEDCGGIPGYYQFLETIEAPGSGEAGVRKREALAWYGGPFDPDDIGEEQIRKSLERIAGGSGARRKTAPS